MPSASENDTDTHALQDTPASIRCCTALPLFLWEPVFISGPMALAADIAVKALLTSTFEQTLMCVMDEATRVVYQGALDRHR